MLFVFLSFSLFLHRFAWIRIILITQQNAKRLQLWSWVESDKPIFSELDSGNCFRLGLFEEISFHSGRIRFGSAWHLAFERQVPADLIFQKVYIFEQNEYVWVCESKIYKIVFSLLIYLIDKIAPEKHKNLQKITFILYFCHCKQR